MAITFLQRAEAAALRTKAKAIVATLATNKNVFTDNFIVVNAPAYSNKVTISVRFPQAASSSSSGSSASGPAYTNIVVFEMEGDAITTFRREGTARWYTYIDELLEDAQDISDTAVSSFSPIDDSEIFSTLTPTSSNEEGATPESAQERRPRVDMTEQNAAPTALAAPASVLRPVPVAAGLGGSSNQPAPVAAPVAPVAPVAAAPASLDAVNPVPGVPVK